MERKMKSILLLTAALVGSFVATRQFFSHYVDGGFSEWSDWKSSCEDECGVFGKQYRSRNCTNPAPSFIGRGCEYIGHFSEKLDCLAVLPCPVNGGWGEWSAPGACNKECGGGKAERFRLCSKPVPKYLGKFCEGPSAEYKDCNTQPCPVDGKFGAWLEYSECSPECRKKRDRKCDAPAPLHGGNGCEGPVEEIHDCTDGKCKLDGGLTHWVDEACSVTCGGGKMKRTRKCEQPKPRNGGKDCEGSREEQIDCNMQPCPTTAAVDGKFGAWSEYSECSPECKKKRDRKCDAPPPLHGGKGCEGPVEEIHDCTDGKCKLDGGFTHWVDETCSVTCGGGKMKRTRKCEQPKPQNGGKDCEGAREEQIDCKTNTPCPLIATNAPSSTEAPTVKVL